jgi:Cytochrome P460
MRSSRRTSPSVGTLNKGLKYASTAGWGFAQFDDGKPAAEAVHKTCFACHSRAKDRDFVFTRYSQ